MKRITRYTVFLVLTFMSCTSIKQRTIKIEQAGQDSKAVVTINTTLRSYFDPDGCSREYQPHIVIRVFGNGKDMAYRNTPGTTFRFGKDFDVDIDYCSGGYLWLSEDMTILGVALFDVIAPTTFQPLKDFNGSYTITKDQAALILNKN